MSKKVKEEKFITEQGSSVLDKVSKVPSWLVILLLKYWAAAAAVFFSVISSDILDFSQIENGNAGANLTISIIIILILGLFMGLFMNYMIRPIVRLMYSRVNNTYKYNMVNVKGIPSLFINLGYHFILSIILFFITIWLSEKGLVLDLFGTAEGSGIEPFTYALCYIIVDFIFLFLKNLIIDLHKRIKYNKEMKAV